jgi:predicted mannosyl-3-phosphoglycerate phosphatase (HAD superfamily)
MFGRGRIRRILAVVGFTGTGCCLIFFDIDQTLLNNSAAARAAAGKFYALHKNAQTLQPIQS